MQNIEFEKSINNYNFIDEQIHLHVKLSKGYSADFVLCLEEKVAKQIVSYMMGGMSIDTLDTMAHSALGEFLNMTAGATICKLNSAEHIDLSTPELIKNFDEFNEYNNKIKYVFNIGESKYVLGVFI